MYFSLCLEFFFQELPIERRIGKAREAGLSRGELWSFRGRDLGALRASAVASGFEITSLCAMEPVPGLNDPSAAAAVRREVQEAMDAANTLGCGQLIVMGGATLPGVPREEQTARIIDALRELAPMARQRGIVLVLEALNSKKSFPGYFLDHTADLFHIIRSVGDPAVRALYDFYHAGIMEGNHLANLRENHHLIGAVQIAGVPDRNEPYFGEMNGPAILRELLALGYTGPLGLEYIPTMESARSLRTTIQWLLTGAARESS